MGKVTFNGKDTDQLGIIIQSPPVYVYPEDEVEVQHIPGRTGDLLLPTGAYQNVTRTYSFATIYADNNSNFVDEARKIISWLKSGKGCYCRLEDSYDPDVYRMAAYVESKELVNYFNKVTVVEAEFNCKPQRWLKSGEAAQTKVTGNTIQNPTGFDALPDLTIETVANTVNTITFTNAADSSDTYTITISSQQSSKTITISSEDMNVAYSSGANANSIVTLSNGFPVFKGLATYNITATCSTLQIKPRWWSL